MCYSRIIKAYIAYHFRHNPKWLPKTVDNETPKHICEFITQKCGLKEKGFEGRKVLLVPAPVWYTSSLTCLLQQYSTAISTRAALTFWYRSIRPHESVTEWRYDPIADVW